MARSNHVTLQSAHHANEPGCLLSKLRIAARCGVIGASSVCHRIVDPPSSSCLVIPFHRHSLFRVLDLQQLHSSLMRNPTPKEDILLTFARWILDTSSPPSEYRQSLSVLKMDSPQPLADRPAHRGQRWTIVLQWLDLRTRIALALLIAGRIAVGLCDLLVAAAMYELFLLLQGHPASPFLQRWALSVASISVVAVILVVTRTLTDNAVAFLALRRIHSLQTELLVRLVRGYGEMRWDKFIARNRSELVNSAIHTTREVADFYHRWIELAASAAIVALMLLAILWKSPSAACAFTAFLACVYLVHQYGFRTHLRRAAVTREGALRDLERELADTLSASKEIRAYRLQTFFQHRIRAIAQRMTSAYTRATLLPQIGKSIADQGALLLFLCIVLVVQLRQGDVHQMLALLAFYFVLSRRLLPIVSQVALIAGQMESSWENLMSLQTELTQCRQFQATEFLTHAPGPAYALEMRSVTFGYHEELPILRNMNLRVGHGNIILLQGPSGAGKSSLLYLIAGIIRPQSGTLLVNRANVAYVPQEVPLLDDSIRNNLLFGLTGIPEMHLVKALKMARMLDFVLAQPSGMDTRVGDNGALLSGGQRQRLGLARALVRGGSLLLLDEATSAVDETSEQQILQGLAASGKTILFVTHHRRARWIAHRVLHLEDARLCEHVPTILEPPSYARPRTLP